LDCGLTEFVMPETELLLLGKDPTVRGRSPTPEGSVDLSGFVAGLPFIRGEIETRECAADKPLTLQNSFRRH
jgi:hypothetical protein